MCVCVCLHVRIGKHIHICTYIDAYIYSYRHAYSLIYPYMYLKIECFYISMCIWFCHAYTLQQLCTGVITCSCPPPIETYISLVPFCGACKSVFARLHETYKDFRTACTTAESPPHSKPPISPEKHWGRWMTSTRVS